VDLCKEDIGLEYSERMLTEAEFHLLKQLDYDLSVPSAIELLHLVLYSIIFNDSTFLLSSHPSDF
jgi:hypothetical protein